MSIEALSKINLQEARLAKVPAVIKRLEGLSARIGHRSGPENYQFTNLRGVAQLDRMQKTGEVRARIQEITIPRLQHLQETLAARLGQLEELRTKLAKVQELADRGYLTPQEVGMAEKAAEYELTVLFPRLTAVKSRPIERTRPTTPQTPLGPTWVNRYGFRENSGRTLIAKYIEGFDVGTKFGPIDVINALRRKDPESGQFTETLLQARKRLASDVSQAMNAMIRQGWSFGRSLNGRGGAVFIVQERATVGSE